MKPENRAEGSSNKALDLIELKGQTGLSNKKWDKAIKGLNKNKLARVEKTDAACLFRWYKVQSISKMTLMAPTSGWGFLFVIWVWNEIQIICTIWLI